MSSAQTVNMLSFVGFVSCMLVLSTAFVVGKPLILARVDRASHALCTHAVVENPDENLPPSYSRILLHKDWDPDNGYGFQEDEDVNSEDGEERTEREWKKIRRYIKRQLKVPTRYLKKIIRTLTKAASVRSVNADDDLVASSETSARNNRLARPSGRFDTKRMLLMNEPKSIKYLVSRRYRYRIYR